MLDIGFENVAYNEETEKIMFIDVENVILSDKFEMKNQNPDWNSSYYLSEFDECIGMPDCLRYNVDQMCTNYHVDINFYSGNYPFDLQES